MERIRTTFALALIVAALAVLTLSALAQAHGAESSTALLTAPAAHP